MTPLPWSRLFAVAMAGLCVVSVARAQSAGKLVPVENPDVHADWQLGEDTGTLHRVADEELGRTVLEYREENPLDAASFYVDIPSEKLEGTDTLRFQWKIVGDPGKVGTVLHGHPDYPARTEKGAKTTHTQGSGRRRYYLHKRPSPIGEWQEVFLDLRHDDDGGKSEAPEGMTRLVISVRMSGIEELGPKPVMAARFADIRFESHPLRVQCDLKKVATLSGDRVGQRYPIEIVNKTDQPQNVKLWVDSSGLDDFDVKLASEQFELGAGEKKIVLAEITTSAANAGKLPPLSMEAAGVYASTSDAPGWVTTWYKGYLVYSLIGAVPADVPDEGPWLSEPEARDRTMAAYEKGHHRIKRNVDRTIEAAKARMDVDPTPPGVAYLHGNPNWKVDKRWNSPVQFRGPGKWYLKKEDRYLSDEEIANAGEKVRRAMGYSHHGWLTQTAATLARAWWYTGEEKYARKAGEIMLAYAERYPQWPRNKPSSLGYYSKVGSGILQESWWARTWPDVFDRVRASGVLSKAQEQKIIDGLLIPVATTIRRHRIEANQQAEINAAYGINGLVAGRWDLAADALNGEGGIRAQWKHDFDQDGFTSEKDMAYHFAAMDGMVQLADALEMVGVNVYDENFKKLFDAPVAYTLDQTPGRYDMYLKAFEKYRDPSYLPGVRVMLKRGAQPSEEVMQAIEKVGQDAFTNSVLPTSGYTVLRAGTNPKDLIAIKMNWGSPSKRHGASMFDTQVFWRGAELTQETGRIGYGYKQSSFSYTVAAGNTLILDGERQTMIRSEQVAMLGGKTPAARWESKEPRPLYPGVSWARTAAIVGETAVILDHLESEQTHRLDWFQYLPGGLKEVTAGGKAPEWQPYEQLLAQGNGYKFLIDPVQATGEGNLPATVTYDAARKITGVMTVTGSGGQLIRSAGWTMWHPKKKPLLIARDEQGEQAWFAATFTATQDGEDVAGATIERLGVTVGGKQADVGRVLAVRVTDATGSYLVLTAFDDAQYEVAGKTVRGPLTVLPLD